MTTIKRAVVIRAVEGAVIQARKRAALAAKKKTRAANYAQGKAYELSVLVQLLKELDGFGYKLECTPKAKTALGVLPKLTFGGSPCRPNHPMHDRIAATRGSEKYEVWVSVQFTTLSYALKGNPALVPGEADRHEIDIGVYQELTGRDYPDIGKVRYAASCKTGNWNKAYVREALGMRRELGFWATPSPSLAPWFRSAVPSDPAIPMVFYSSDLRCLSYSSLSLLGLYVLHAT